MGGYVVQIDNLKEMAGMILGFLDAPRAVTKFRNGCVLMITPDTDNTDRRCALAAVFLQNGLVTGHSVLRTKCRIRPRNLTLNSEDWQKFPPDISKSIAKGFPCTVEPLSWYGHGGVKILERGRLKGKNLEDIYDVSVVMAEHQRDSAIMQKTRIRVDRYFLSEHLPDDSFDRFCKVCIELGTSFFGEEVVIVFRDHKDRSASGPNALCAHNGSDQPVHLDSLSMDALSLAMQMTTCGAQTFIVHPGESRPSTEKRMKVYLQHPSKLQEVFTELKNEAAAAQQEIDSRQPTEGGSVGGYTIFRAGAVFHAGLQNDKSDECVLTGHTNRTVVYVQMLPKKYVDKNYWWLTSEYVFSHELSEAAKLDHFNQPILSYTAFLLGVQNLR
jgi:hypothetical protein